VFQKRDVELFAVTSSTVNNQFWKLLDCWKHIMIMLCKINIIFFRRLLKHRYTTVWNIKV